MGEHEREIKQDNYTEKMTNEEYRSMIIKAVNSIDNNRFLELIYNLIKSAIKKWL